jgi:hypothetical protein
MMQTYREMGWKSSRVRVRRCCGLVLCGRREHNFSRLTCRAFYYGPLLSIEKNDVLGVNQYDRREVVCSLGLADYADIGGRVG